MCSTQEILFGKRVCVLLFVALLGAAAGCQRERETGQDTTSLVRDAELSPSPSPNAAIDSSDALVAGSMARLPEPLQKMLGNGTFATWVSDQSNVDFTKQNGNFANHGPDAVYLDPKGSCAEAAFKGHVRVVVESEKRARKLKKKAIGDYGVVLARISNPTNCTTQGFVLTPRQTLYWVAVPESSADSGMTFHFVEDHKSIRTSKVQVCHDTVAHPKDHQESRANMVAGPYGANLCEYKNPVDFMVQGKDFNNHNSRPWVTCDWGCCVAVDG